MHMQAHATLVLSNKVSLRFGPGASFDARYWMLDARQSGGRAGVKGLLWWLADNRLRCITAAQHSQAGMM